MESIKTGLGVAVGIYICLMFAALVDKCSHEVTNLAKFGGAYVRGSDKQ